MKYETRTHRLRGDISLHPPDDLLRELVVSEGWLEDEATNRLMGHGRGRPGVVNAKEHFVKALDGSMGSWLVGIYKRGWPSGFVVLTKGPTARRAVSFSMWLAPSERGKAGVAPTALALLADAVFDMGFYRLETEVFSTNKKALKWLKHEKFTQEGFKKFSWWSDDEPHSTATFRMLASDWRRMNKQREVA